MTIQTITKVTDVKTVANYFLSKSKMGTDLGITHLKLQKLVYFAQAWHLGLKGEPLFDSEIQAWIHGPVCPDLYNEYRNSSYKELEPVTEPEIAPGVKEVLDSVWEIYGSYDGKFLEELTHLEKPWINARENLLPDAISNNVITHKDMTEYYTID